MLSTLYQSPSSRGRGLKPLICHKSGKNPYVALFTRAWIETLFTYSTSVIKAVALFTRAWIETFWSAFISIGVLSPSSRGRGLKHQPTVNTVSKHMSPSSRGRGLKRCIVNPSVDSVKSPSSRGRGLKQTVRFCLTVDM